MESRRGARALCVGLQAAVVLLAWHPFVTGRASPFEKDVEFYHHPVTRELVSAWSEGRVALWTDRIYCGFPFFADSQTGAWYPGTLLVAALGPHSGYVLFLVLHALLCAAGLSLLVRAHGGDRAAAWASGLLVPLSGFFVYETQHPQLFAILCWLPVSLLAVRAVFLRPSPLRIAAGALPLAMMILPGTIQVLFGAVALLGGYALGLCIDAWRARGGRVVLTGLAAVALAQGLGLGLAAVVLVPGFAHFPDTARSLGMTYGLASMGSVHPLRLLGLLVSGAPEVATFDLGTDFADAPLYTGALLLPLAAVGIVAAGRGMRVGLGAGALLLAVIAAGRYGGLHPLLYEWLPGAVGAVRGVGRAIGPLVVCLALLAGLGLHRVGEGRVRLLLVVLAATSLVQGGVALAAPGRETLGAAVVQAVALGAAVALRRRPARLRAALALLVVLDLLALGAARELLSAKPPPPSARRLTGEELFPALPAIASGRFAPERAGAEERGERVLLLGFGAGNFTFHHGLDGVGGYNPLVTLQYLDYASLANHGRVFPREPLRGFVHPLVPGRVHDGLLDASAVRFVVSAVPLPWEGVRLLERYGPHPRTGGPVLLYENERALPRAYLAYRTRRADRAADLERLLGPGFDPRRTTVFEGVAPELDGPARIDPVHAERPRPERLRLDVAPDRDALLVVTDAWHPGWRAWVDGEAAEVLRVNAHFRGVVVPSAARRVELSFEPRSFRAGASISLAALAVMTLLAGSDRFLRKRGI